jgi:hypothetical protein
MRSHVSGGSIVYRPIAASSTALTIPCDVVVLSYIADAPPFARSTRKTAF